MNYRTFYLGQIPMGKLSLMGEISKKLKSYVMRPFDFLIFLIVKTIFLKNKLNILKIDTSN